MFTRVQVQGFDPQIQGNEVTGVKLKHNEANLWTRVGPFFLHFFRNFPSGSSCFKCRTFKPWANWEVYV